MFRHTTKQSTKSQEKLRADASAALDRGRQILCSKVYDNTYCVHLPSPSIHMLNNIVIPLTGHNSEIKGDSRRLYTIARFVYARTLAVRVCFIQPEVSSATAVSRSSHSLALSRSRSLVCKSLNNPSPGRITASKEKCQVIGRLSPYIVDRSGLTAEVQWTYYNASKSRIFYVVSSPDGINMMSATKETMCIYQAFCTESCAMVYVSAMRCFKITVSPENDADDDNPNKSTCVFLYCDGTYKVLGTPHKSYRVCNAMRDIIIRSHTSSMHSKLMDSLVELEETGSKVEG